MVYFISVTSVVKINFCFPKHLYALSWLCLRVYNVLVVLLYKILQMSHHKFFGGFFVGGDVLKELLV